MHSIHKFPVHVRDRFELRLPQGALFLSVQVQNGVAQQWWKIDLEQPKETRVFRVRGTGHDFTPNTPELFLGTFQMVDGSFVGHLFELVTEKS